MEILMSGELYIKKGPTITKTDPSIIAEEKEEFAMYIENLKESNLSEETIDQFIQRHEEEMKIKTEGIKDYSGCDNFWMSIINDDGIEMLEKDVDPILESQKSFKSKEDVDKEFIRLRVFLEKANYVGKYFKRTEWIKTTIQPGRTSMDMSYNTTFSHPKSHTFVLYESGDMMLALLELHDNKKWFQVISSKYLEDGKYKFVDGEMDNEYSKYTDKAVLYQDILKQCFGEKKKKL